MEQARAARITILEDGEGKEAPRILQKLMKITSQGSNRRKNIKINITIIKLDVSSSRFIHK